ncbi:HCO3 transporter family-domain-containing protein [Tuber borchii]|uniref:HCO3 transporter family-domain-containing protein n=1 Tax=Tuber borchii TaxID=42251 RepID=A0A2T6ZD31_TUBBO|nr:HCO3 transporter family-domain-containing protein [Tuber borchii]
MDTSPASTTLSTGSELVPVDPEKGLHPQPDTIPTPRKSKLNKFHFLRPTVHGVVTLFRGEGALAPFRLLKSDFKGRAKIYHTDWGFNQLVLASAVFVFFTNLLPGITFASDLYVLTGRNYGAIEVVFSTGLCGIIFALFSGQPLTILGVTGPFCILSEPIYALCHEDFHISYLPFMAWACIHSAWMHWLLAIFNAHDWIMEYVTTFSTEIFPLLNSVIYFHKAVQELERSHANTSFASFLYSVIGYVGTFLVAVTLSTANSWAPLFHRYVRMGLAEYAAAISINIFIAIPQIGELNNLDQQRLPVSTSFHPTSPDRTHFIVEFWTLPARWIFAAIIPGLIITTLFFFDVEVSTICATLPQYNIRKLSGYAWDVALLGITTALCGILGIPPANGLLPQAPLHSESLLHDEAVERWSHHLHAIGIMLFVSPPFMHVLGLIPTSVLVGLFLYMGEQSLSVNPILFRFFNILTPSSELPQLPSGIKGYREIHMYTLFQIVITAGVFAITFTPGAPVFPVIIVLLVPIWLNLINKWWSRETLKHMLPPMKSKSNANAPADIDSWACKEGDFDTDDARDESHDARREA